MLPLPSPAAHARQRLHLERGHGDQAGAAGVGAANRRRGGADPARDGGAEVGTKRANGLHTVGNVNVVEHRGHKTVTVAETSLNNRWG